MCIVCAGGLSWLPTGGQQPWSATGSGFFLPGHVGLDGPVGLNADARGGTGPNGRPSLTPTGAGERLTRSNTTWGDAIGAFDHGNGAPIRESIALLAEATAGRQ